MARRFDNKINLHRQDPNRPTVRKVTASQRALRGEHQPVAIG
jgi:hypothetical protein